MKDIEKTLEQHHDQSVGTDPVSKRKYHYMQLIQIQFFQGLLHDKEETLKAHRLKALRLRQKLKQLGFRRQRVVLKLAETQQDNLGMQEFMNSTLTLKLL